MCLGDGASDGAEIITSRAETVETEVCIVGAGPVGLVLADVLSTRGVHVTLLERGTASGRIDITPMEPPPAPLVRAARARRRAEGSCG